MRFQPITFFTALMGLSSASPIHMTPAPGLKGLEIESQIKKRWTRSCIGKDSWAYPDAHRWVPIDQFYAGKDSFCNDVQAQNNGQGISNGQEFEKIKHFYPGSTQWIHFRNTAGGKIDVWWKLYVRPGVGWDWNRCFNAFFQLIYECKGRNPDIVGGQIDNYDGYHAYVHTEYVVTPDHADSWSY